MSWQFDFLVRVLHNLSSEKRTRDSLNRFLLRLRMILMRGNDGALGGVLCCPGQTSPEEYGAEDDSGRNLAQLAK